MWEGKKQNISFLREDKSQNFISLAARTSLANLKPNISANCFEFSTANIAENAIEKI